MKQMTTSRRQPNWDLRAAGNFIGGGTGSGLLMASALAAALGQSVIAPQLVGLLCIGIGLTLVWLEIGRPWRAFNVFFHPQTSWMTRESIVALPLFAAGAAAAFFQGPGLTIVAALLALGFLYCQAPLLKAARGIPAWSHPRTVPLIVLTGVAEGSGIFLALGAPTTAMIAAALVMSVAREGALEAYRRGLVATGAPEGTLIWFRRPEAQSLRILRLAAIMLMVAGLLGFTAAAVIGGGIAMLTGWAVKAILVTRAAYTCGLLIPRTPTRGRSAARPVTPA